ncbi:translocon-associated protein subunit delta [Anser cygnoides]|uniref:translocon-associated protein subunit delta n=1 Tax=Anser cygnoides TaxID=8845 RepID=UPI0034D1DB70
MCAARMRRGAAATFLAPPPNKSRPPFCRAGGGTAQARGVATPPFNGRATSRAEEAPAQRRSRLPLAAAHLSAPPPSLDWAPRGAARRRLAAGGVCRAGRAVPAAKMAALGLLLGLLAAALGVGAEPCPEPTIAPSYYTTADAVIASESVFVVELSLACKNGAQNVALYADVNGKQFPVTRGQDVGRYQVSWSLEHRSAQSGTYEVKFFDEESYSALRKAQRNNEDVSRIRPLFTVNVDHRGAWSGPWVATEVVAAAVGLVVYYLALSTKSSIQA